MHHRPFLRQSHARVGRPREDLKIQENLDQLPEMLVSQEALLLVVVAPLAGAAKGGEVQLQVLAARVA